MMSVAMVERAPRVTFERAYKARVVGIDGTWWRSCELVDISVGGAQIAVESYPAKLDEFFLVLSTVGKPAHRRCKMVWVRGGRMGVEFLGTNTKRRLRSVDIGASDRMIG